MTTVVASPGQGPDRQVEVQYSDTKVIFVYSKIKSIHLVLGIFS